MTWLRATRALLSVGQQTNQSTKQSTHYPTNPSADHGRQEILHPNSSESHPYWMTRSGKGWLAREVVTWLRATRALLSVPQQTNQSTKQSTHYPTNPSADHGRQETLHPNSSQSHPYWMTRSGKGWLAREVVTWLRATRALLSVGPSLSWICVGSDDSFSRPGSSTMVMRDL